RTYAAPDGLSDQYRHVATDAAGRIYVCGTTGGDTLNPVNSRDWLVQRYSGDGTLEATATFNGSGNHLDLTRTIVVDGSGRACVIGEFRTGTTQATTNVRIAAYESDTAGPTGGAFSLTPPLPAPTGTMTTAHFTGWTDASPPL